MVIMPIDKVILAIMQVCRRNNATANARSLFMLWFKKLTKKVCCENYELTNITYKIISNKMRY